MNELKYYKIITNQNNLNFIYIYNWVIYMTSWK